MRRGRKSKSETAKKSNKTRYDNESRISSTEENPKAPHNSVDKIAKMAKSSGSTVSRMKKIRKD